MFIFQQILEYFWYNMLLDGDEKCFMMKIDNLRVKIKDSDIEILKELSLNIGAGEVHAIMGPNGTGKSTLSNLEVTISHPVKVIQQPIKNN